MEPLRFVRSRADALVALALTLLLQVEVWIGWTGSPEEATERLSGDGQLVVAALALAATTSLAWRRRFPLVCLVLALPLTAAIGRGGLDGWPALLVLLAVVALTVGAECRDGAAITGAIGVAGLIAMAIVRDPDALANPGDLVVPTVILGGSWAAGIALRRRHDAAEISAERATELERTRELATRSAVADERARIARDLHDVVAHGISVIVVQARGGRRALDRDPEQARAALEAIEATASGSLAELRRLVEVVRAPDGPAALEPRPGMRDLPRLVEQMRSAGLPVDLHVEGDPIDLAPGVDLSAYRILQQALTNALEHAGPAATVVTVRYLDDALDLEVADAGVAASSARSEGHGLVGMRERAALVGGWLEAGPRERGGFEVRARLPLGPMPA